MKMFLTISKFLWTCLDLSLKNQEINRNNISITLNVAFTSVFSQLLYITKKN